MNSRHASLRVLIPFLFITASTLCARHSAEAAGLHFVNPPGTYVYIADKYEYDGKAVGEDTSATVTYRLTSGPSTMTLDSTTGYLEWFADTLGDFHVAIEAHNDAGGTAVQDFRLTVATDGA